jgi:hypothetical protein
MDNNTTTTTSILDLPIDPMAGGNISNNIPVNNMSLNNIPLNNTDNLNISNNTINNNQVSLDPSTINQIVNGLQQASATGATLLPSRDIPQNTNNLTQDPYVQQNYIPNNHQPDYIKNNDPIQNVMQNYNKNNYSSLDEVYAELQIPLLMSVLYFLFQLPFFTKLLFNHLPMLFSKEGNMNINGFIFKSVLFGSSFYLLNKATKQFDKF